MEVRRDNFSWAGLEAIFEHLEQYEDDCGEEVEFDPIAICCDYSEHDTALECVDDMGYNMPNIDDDDSLEDKEGICLAFLRDNTMVIEFTGGIIIQGF